MPDQQSRDRRQFAAQRLEAARQTTEFRVRAKLLDMAQTWLDLAHASENGANDVLAIFADDVVAPVIGAPRKIASAADCKPFCRERL
jgi:hypothetical protein